MGFIGRFRSHVTSHIWWAMVKSASQSSTALPCDSGDAELADGARAALNDVRAKQARLATDAQLSPHVLGFAQSKTAGAKLLAQGRYAEAEQEYEGALRAMRAALQELPAEASGGMRATMEALERGMREELAAAKKRAAGSE